VTLLRGVDDGLDQHVTVGGPRPAFGNSDPKGVLRDVGLIRSRRRQMKGGYDGSDGDGSEEATTA
jgi:hypothetical protein